MTVSPLIQTSRLYLREITRDDFSNLYSLLSDLQVQQFIGKPYDLWGSRRFFNAIQRSYKKHGYSFWAVCDSQTHSFLGICGLLKINILGRDTVEISYRLNPQSWGQGYAQEAVEAVLQFAEIKLNLKNILLLTHPENEASKTIARKNGFSVIGHDEHLGVKHQVWQR